MTTQWLVTSLVLLAAVVYAGWRIYAYFGKPKNPQGVCDKFSGDCEACMKHFADKNPKPAKECGD